MKNRKIRLLSTLFVLCMLLVGCGKEKERVTGAENLAGHKIGVQTGTTGDIYACDEYEGDDAGTTIEKYNKGIDAIMALKQDKIDCIIIDSEPAKAFVENNPELMILDDEYVVEEYAICLAKENTQLRDQINQALEELEANGVMDQIRKNYTGTDEEKGMTPYIKKDVERSNGILIMATNAAFQPYEYYDKNQIVGLDVDMMQAICDILQMDFKIEDIEFNAVINAVTSGKADVGVSGMTITEDRLKTVNFSNSYTTAKQVIIVKNPEVSAQKLSLAEKFKVNFITDNRWKYLAEGLFHTLIITVFAIMIGIVLGFLIAIIRACHDMNGTFTILDWICRMYLAVIRGTPVMVQILIIYYVIFASVDINKILVAILAFGLNSAAYVAEIVRSGIMAVDEGQFEAGRSLGLTYSMTMIHIILPQAIKNILPALGNEFINLLKETSISGYIGLSDLTRGGVIIQSLTYEAFLPLLAVAAIYLAIVMLLSAGVNKLERSLRTNER